MTTVTARARRGVGYGSFGDLADPPLVVTGIERTGDGQTAVTFDIDLDATTVDAVRARMTSTNDEDQAARANLAALSISDTTASPLTRALVAYLLGDS